MIDFIIFIVEFVVILALCIAGIITIGESLMKPKSVVKDKVLDKTGVVTRSDDDVWNTVLWGNGDVSTYVHDTRLEVIEDPPEIMNMLFGNSFGEYRVSREWEDEWFDFLNRNGFNVRGFMLNQNLANERGGFENNVFMVLPYYWGDDEEEAMRPNFLHKDSGYEIRWYKYPFRDSYANMRISLEEFKDILKMCEESLCT